MCVAVAMGSGRRLNCAEHKVSVEKLGASVLTGINHLIEENALLKQTSFRLPFWIVFLHGAMWP